MATITEDYVSFETAKALKEKGFDEYYPFWYNLDKPIEGPFFYKEIGWYGHNSYDYNGKRIVSSPTQAVAMKWLREVHNISIEPLVDFGSGDGYWWTADVGYIKKDGLINELCGYNSYEEACEAAIKYCLENLI